MGRRFDPDGAHLGKFTSIFKGKRFESEFDNFCEILTGTNLIFSSRKVAFGLVGGVTGGLLRDVLCQVEPVLLHRETIGTSCLAGALAYAGLHHLDLSEGLAAVIAGFIIVLVREISIKLDWHLPKI